MKEIVFQVPNIAIGAIGIVIIYEFILSVIFAVLMVNDETGECGFIQIIQKLFSNRNLFGKILSFIIVLSGIPAILFLFLIDILFRIIKLLYFIWKLGDKEE